MRIGGVVDRRDVHRPGQLSRRRVLVDPRPVDFRDQDVAVEQGRVAVGIGDGDRRVVDVGAIADLADDLTVGRDEQNAIVGSVATVIVPDFNR